MRISDWSSDVCSSDLADARECLGQNLQSDGFPRASRPRDAAMSIGQLRQQSEFSRCVFRDKNGISHAEPLKIGGLFLKMKGSSLSERPSSLWPGWWLSSCCPHLLRKDERGEGE